MISFQFFLSLSILRKLAYYARSLDILDDKKEYSCSSIRKWQDYVYIQCEYKSTKQKIKHLLREENKVKENKIS